MREDNKNIVSVKEVVSEGTSLNNAELGKCFFGPIPMEADPLTRGPQFHVDASDTIGSRPSKKPSSIHHESNTDKMAPGFLSEQSECTDQAFSAAFLSSAWAGDLDHNISHAVMQYMQGLISANINDACNASDASAVGLNETFGDVTIPQKPMSFDSYHNFVVNKLVAHSAPTASPKFVGHMTSILPSFMLPLAEWMVALNQNVVKVETSNAFTSLERQTIGMLHGLVYEQDELFYAQYLHHAQSALGVFCSGGTLANITALWVARNRLLGPHDDFKGVAHSGLTRALKYYGYEGIAILVSERGHYSLSKAVDVLGIGREDLVLIPTDDQDRIDLALLEKKCADLRAQGIQPMALVGIAGTTETGAVDDLQGLAAIAQAQGCHFHVDAAWGGPTLFSATHKAILKGIALADSVTIDAHKQLYVPMGAGVALFKDPELIQNIEHHAAYIIRKDSQDLGRHTIEGSRASMALLVHGALQLLGQQGYEQIIDQGIEKTRAFATLIQACSDFELISTPVLNIVTYRYVPKKVYTFLEKATVDQASRVNEILNRLNACLQETQKRSGKTFVSRTQLNPVRYGRSPIVVLRVVLANPLTTLDILREVLSEQRQIIEKELYSDLSHELAEVMI